MHLTQSQRDELASAIQTQLGTLQSQLELRRQGLTNVDQAYDEKDREADDACQHGGDHEVESAQSDIDQDEFDALSNALQRVHTPGYGLCVDCGQFITYDRLKVEPQSTRCLACETVRERNI
jgi:RNA polymerase-binding transcription factor DksA